jgi:hypothetical protein
LGKEMGRRNKMKIAVIIACLAITVFSADCADMFNGICLSDYKPPKENKAKSLVERTAVTIIDGSFYCNYRASNRSFTAYYGSSLFDISGHFDKTYRVIDSSVKIFINPVSYWVADVDIKCTVPVEWGDDYVDQKCVKKWLDYRDKVIQIVLKDFKERPVKYNCDMIVEEN